MTQKTNRPNFIFIVADDLGFAMIAVPEHFVIPTEHKDLSGDFYSSAYPGMAFYAGATSRIRVGRSDCFTNISAAA